ncbi:Myosin-IIIa [Lamellibrachia satsuma]|nr:Myosin-IIIa [Lamellibrachia satsuma]
MTELITCLISRTSIINAEEMVVLKTLEQAKDERDAVAKALYSRLFGWIVRQINSNLSQSSQGSRLSSLSIGILDLSGFENFIDNSFEQLCINVANEKLQHFFNTFIFTAEQAIYEEECIDWSHIEFCNNEDILRLFLGEEGVGQTKKMIFTRKLDLFAILDDESKSPRATDTTLVRNWCKHLGDHPNFSRIEGDELGFCITHYADQVVYNASNFLEKNRDRLSPNLLTLLQKSDNDFIKDLFFAVLDDTGVLSRTRSRIRSGSKRVIVGNARASYVGQGSISGNTLKKLKTRYVSAVKSKEADTKCLCPECGEDHLTTLQGEQKRCIKPNENQCPEKFSEKFVARQLEYSGVLQIAKIGRIGYPVRMTFGNFIKRQV